MNSFGIPCGPAVYLTYHLSEPGVPRLQLGLHPSPAHDLPGHLERRLDLPLQHRCGGLVLSGLEEEADEVLEVGLASGGLPRVEVQLERQVGCLQRGL